MNVTDAYIRRNKFDSFALYFLTRFILKLILYRPAHIASVSPKPSRTPLRSPARAASLDSVGAIDLPKSPKASHTDSFLAQAKHVKVVYSVFHRVGLTLIQADKVDDTDETQLDEPLDHKAAEVVDDVSSG